MSGFSGGGRWSAGRSRESRPDRCKCRICCCLWPRRRLPNENILVLSMIQILCGVAAMVLSGICINLRVFLYQLGAGVWSGGLMMATGTQGMCTSRRKGPCTLVTLLVLCVLSSITAVLLTCMCTAGLIEDGVRREPPRKDTPRVQLVVMHAILLMVSLLEASVAITTAVMCARQLCSNTTIFQPGMQSSINGERLPWPHIVRATPATGFGPGLLLVVPAANDRQSGLVFPPFPPAYSTDDPRPLLTPSGAPECMFHPALLLEEDPPPYATLDRGDLNTGSSSTGELPVSSRDERVTLPVYPGR